jgi:hypothetical protein
MPKSIFDLCREIAEDPAPVVMLDTCAVLDIIRAPIRANMRPDIVSAAEEIAARASARPRTAWVIATETVLGEWSDHYDTTTREVARQFRRVDTDIELIRAVASQALPNPAFVPPAVAALGLETQLQQIAQSLVDVAEVLRTEQDAELRAGRRVQFGQPPSSKGKSEYKDCLIFEHYLTLSQCLQQAGFQEARFLVTSNVSDYGNPTAPDNPLAPEFAAAGLTYVTDLWWLRSSIA